MIKLKINESLIKRRGVYNTWFTTIGEIYNCVKNNLIRIPIEQRELGSTETKTFINKAVSYICSLLLEVFSTNYETSYISNILSKKLGVKNPDVREHTSQFMAITIDENENLWLEDGHHRYEYLHLLILGLLVIRNDIDLKNNFLNSVIDDIFNAIQLEDGEGNLDSDKAISIFSLSDEQMEKLFSLPVVVPIVMSSEYEERASVFIRYNSCTPPKTNDLVHANYAVYNMWIAIEKLHKALNKVKPDTGLTLFNNRIQYDAQDAAKLRALLYAPMGTFVAMIAHAGLLTFLSKKTVKDYQWVRGDNDQQKQINSFFKATASFSIEECYDYLIAILNKAIQTARTCYDNDVKKMSDCNKMRSLVIGQLHAVHNFAQFKTKRSIFNEKAFELTSKISLDEGYRPYPDSEKIYQRKDFNTAHYSRERNEYFMNFLKIECDKCKEGKFA